MNYEPGMLVKSKAGHDKGCIYVIISVKNEYVYLADGALRPLSRMKKKNIRHLQPILSVKAGSISNDSEIRHLISEYIRRTKERA